MYQLHAYICTLDTLKSAADYCSDLCIFIALLKLNAWRAVVHRLLAPLYCIRVLHLHFRHLPCLRVARRLVQPFNICGSNMFCPIRLYSILHNMNCLHCVPPFCAFSDSFTRHIMQYVFIESQIFVLSGLLCITREAYFSGRLNGIKVISYGMIQIENCLKFCQIKLNGIFGQDLPLTQILFSIL